jgi:hypothetical protein
MLSFFGAVAIAGPGMTAVLPAGSVGAGRSQLASAAEAAAIENVSPSNRWCMKFLLLPPTAQRFIPRETTPPWGADEGRVL